jgi:L-asparagine transporter-like permease
MTHKTYLKIITILFLLIVLNILWVHPKDLTLLINRILGTLVVVFYVIFLKTNPEK